MTKTTKQKKTFGERFAALPDAAQNAIARHLNLADLRALQQSDAKWKPLARRHARRYENALDAVRDARRLRERAILERAALQRRRDGLRVERPLHNFGSDVWIVRQRETRARALVDYMHRHPSLGRRLYRDIREHYRRWYPGCIISHIEIDATGFFDELKTNDEASMHVYFVTADGRHRVQWTRYEFWFSNGTWKFKLYESDVDEVEYHLPYLLLPTGKIARVS